jgi:putative phosphoribosyl transferase
MIFDSLSSKFQFKFKDRVAAADILGESLKDRIKNKEEQKAAIVLGIPRAGVITADIIAKKLSTSFFDIVIPRKLTHPNNKEVAVGGIMEDGTLYINGQLVNDFQISSEYLEKEKLEQLEEIKRRTILYCKEPRKDFSSFLEDKTVILVDDGAATGATIIAAARWIRRLENTPKRLIIALPIAPKCTVNLLKRECNAEVDVILSPSSSTFHSVEQYHQNFQPITDEQVIRIMKDRKLLPQYPMS